MGADGGGGPKAREILTRIVEDDSSDEAFPYLAAREVTLKGGLKGRLFRISFSGELAYELAVPAGYGESVADAVLGGGRGVWDHALRLGDAWACCASRRATSRTPRSTAR